MSDYKRGRSYDRDQRDDDDYHGQKSRSDDPPNSRLFIVTSKEITEDEFREVFGAYGTIEEIWLVKDRATSLPKGIVYIKFSKTSEAALAVEEMHGKCMPNHPRPMKVMIAHNRDKGNIREQNEEERLVRLFVVVPKSMTEAELRQEFEEYGDLEYVTLVKDRNTKENKGFGYVKYHRMSHAARAFENCDRSYKPVFADPKPKPDMYGGRSGGPSSASSGGGYHGGGQELLNYMDTSHSNPEGNCRLQALTSSSINQDQLWKLFDLVPGLDYCELKRGDRGAHRGGFGVIVYNNPQSATYAKEKLHGFEYPPGFRMSVRFDRDQPMTPGYGMGGGMGGQRMPPMGMGGMGGGHRAAPSQGQSMNGAARSLPPDLQVLQETISKATAAIQAAGYNVGGGDPMGGGEDGFFSVRDPSNVKLPSPQPLAQIDALVAERLFIVCSPRPPPPYVLKDAFCRFGNLIDIYMLQGKTCGYAKFADATSAQKAVDSLHMQEVGGARLKVMIAEARDTDSRKRPKMDTE